VPEPEATAMLLEVVEDLASNGLEFDRGDLRNAFEKRGIQGDLLEGYMFALQRTIPGIEHVDRNLYRLPENWKMATKYRTRRFKLPKLDVLSAIEMKKHLADTVNEESSDTMKEALRTLTADLEGLW
jgi:hypothetical protein